MATNRPETFTTAHFRANYSMAEQGYICRFVCATCGGNSTTIMRDWDTLRAGVVPLPEGWDVGRGSPRCVACAARRADAVADELLGAWL